MKLSRFLTTLGISSVLVAAQVIGLPNQKPKVAQAQSSPRPYVVLVNGYEDCCVWNAGNRGVYMGTVVNELQRQGAEFRLVPWDTFRDGAGQRSSTSNDAAFLRDAADFINNQLDRNRPLILIGHSFGGDSLLSLAPRINRRIQFLGVIDPTAAGGLREPVTRRGVPSNVDYFFNRWQKNALNSDNVVPFDSRVVNGSISGCQARNCDQQEQNLARREDGSEIRVKCQSHEVTCKGYNPIPGRSNGTKAKRLAHNDMPLDAYLQRQMANRINQVLRASQPTSLFSDARRYDAGVLHPNGKAYFFAGDKYYRFDFQSDQLDKIGRIGVDGWKGLPANIGAAILHPNGKAYFFVGNQYYRFDFQSDQVDKIGRIGVDGWKGLPANIGAAMIHLNGKAYFFAGDQYYQGKRI
jgi:hypothetical protein